MPPATLIRVLSLTVIAAVVAVAASAQSITGVITDAQRGNALGSMVASAYAPDPTCSTARVVCWKNIANATSSVTGRYTLNVPTGSIRVLAYDPDALYATQFSADAESFDVSPVTAVSGTLPVVVNFALRTAGSITGSAVTSGGPRIGIVIAAYNLSGTRRGFTTTAKDGSFSFFLPPGNYKLVAYDETGTFATAFYRDRPDFATSDIVPVAAGKTFTGAEFSLPIGARYSGTVTDSAGTPLAGITVTAYNSAGIPVASSFTGANGTFSITLPGGTYRFAAGDEARLYASAYLGAALSFDSSPAITLSGGQSRFDLRFKMQVGGRLSGKVTDARTGGSLGGMTVVAYNADGSLRTQVMTDPTGGYELLLPPGSYLMAAWDDSSVFAPQFYALRKAYRFASTVNATAGGAVQLQPFALAHAGHFSGAVTTQSGAPVAGAAVAACDPDGYAAATTTTNSAGRYRLTVNEDSYRVIAYDTQLRYAVSYGGATSFDTTPLRNIAADAEQTVSFTLAAGTRVSGHVVSATSQPVSGVDVTVYDTQGNRMASATTAGDGSFQVVLMPGAYKFGARDGTGRYPASFLGGASLTAASVVTVDVSGAPQIVIRMALPARRRSVR